MRRSSGVGGPAGPTSPGLPGFRHNVRMTARLLPSLAALLLAACGSASRAGADAPAESGASFVIVRHAEKTSDSEHDPDLSAAGHARARALAALLADADLVAIHTTDFRRTRQTVQPTADGHGLEPGTYDAKMSAGEFAARLRAEHPRGTVLVAGHSNTVPGIVAALCACTVEPMPETEYDRLSTVQVDGDGHARLRVTRFDAVARAP